MEYLILASSWVIYFLFHSLLASTRVKTFFYRYVNRIAYRLVYSFLAIFGLFALLLVNARSTHYLFTPNMFTRYFSLMLATFSIIVIRLAFKQYSLADFLGFGEETTMTLKREGILDYIRHPIYSATILMVCGFFIFVPTIASLVSALCIFSYLPIGIWLEEKKLISQLGGRYLEYRKEVPALVPTLSRLKNLLH